MNFEQLYHQFITDIRSTGWMEFIAVFAGIASVWYSRVENILVYPVGLINTIFYIYLSIKGHLIGEASVNLYYTIMSIYGWILWNRKDAARNPVMAVKFSSGQQWLQQIGFFSAFYIVIFLSLRYLKQSFAPGAIPWADAFASATAYTGMWLMAKKKVESWWWWILTDISSIPLYFVKHYVFTSVYYLVLLVMAVFGLIEWMQRAKAQKKKR